MYQERARELVLDVVRDNLEKTDDTVVELGDIYVVWFAKTLQNWKALVSTTLPDGRYYEVTHDGHRDQTYIDVYVKIQNKAVNG